jgi:hypothetical protein
MTHPSVQDRIGESVSSTTAAGPSPQSSLPHEPRDALAATADSPRRQLSMNAWSAIGPATGVMDRSNALKQFMIRPGSRRWSPRPPCPVATG